MKLFYNFICSAFILSYSLFLQPVFSQLKFKQHNTRQNIHSGIICGVVDINGDYYDDLLVLDEGKQLWLGTNNGNAYFFWKKLDYKSTQPLWSIAVADLDRNGLNDILIGGDFYGVRILYQEQLGFRNDTVSSSQFYSQASSIYDINKDGFLDFTLCDDNAKTRVFENINGELYNNYTWIDLSQIIPQNEEGNYGCLWSDMDQDGDGDLYISKCSAKAKDDPKDPRRINLYYQQQADFTFIENAKILGIASSEQSWISVSGDLDGDGRFDLIVANHYGPSQVFQQNSNGSFDDRTVDSGIKLNSFPFQFALEDWDNDGDLDLLSVGSDVELFLNNGSGVFERGNIEMDFPKFTSLSWGDINEDGILDIYASYAGLINNPTIIPDRLWLGESNNNHWISIGLKGKKSNENGIGAIVKIHLGEKIILRELQSGTAYGLQKSLNLHFGLGSSNKIDSMFIHWPSGIVDRFFDIPVDQYFLCSEGSCITPRNKIFPRGEINLCEGENLELLSYVLYDNLLWNTGDKKDTILVNKSGSYFYKAVNKFNCPIVSENTTLKIDPEENPRLNYSGEVILCEGENISLSVSGFENIIWSNKATSSTILVNQEGSYSAKYIGICRDFYTDTVKVKIATKIELPVIAPDTLKGPGTTILESNIDDTYWYNNKSDPNPIYEGRAYKTDSILKDRSFWARSFSGTSYTPLTGGMKVPSYDDAGLPGNFLNPRTYFEAFKNFVLDSISVYTDSAGIRIFELGKLNDTVIYQRISHSLEKGLNRIYLGFQCYSGQKYTLGTNTAQNQQNFNHRSPRLLRSNKGFNYPFVIGELCKINTSEFGDSYYYGMFDWKITEEEHICYSEWVEVPVHVIITNSGDINKFSNNSIITLRSGEIYVESDQKMKSLKIYTINSQLLSQSSNNSLSVSTLIPGIYILEVNLINSSLRYKVVIQ
ncbi:MAG: CRTAC1 family protein [Saprospiraceae bacterium]|nr:CRTAC1 family protein [Saprospiraceae bacterium]